MSVPVCFLNSLRLCLQQYPIETPFFDKRFVDNSLPVCYRLFWEL